MTQPQFCLPKETFGAERSQLVQVQMIQIDIETLDLLKDLTFN